MKNQIIFLFLLLPYSIAAQIHENKVLSVAAYCSADDKVSDALKKEAHAVGELLCKNEFHLITGGSKTGLMHEVMNGFCMREQSNKRMSGVLPEIFKQYNVVHPQLLPENIIWTTSIHERLAHFQKNADIFLILPGGFGTLQEFFDILVPKQFGIHKKRIILFNPNRYWNNLITLVDDMVQNKCVSEPHKKLFEVASNVDELGRLLQTSHVTVHGDLDSHYWQAK